MATASWMAVVVEPDHSMFRSRAYSVSSAAIRAEAEQSLRLLQTDHIDLYYLHRPDPNFPIEQSIDPIISAKQDGRVRHIGLSNVTLDQLDRVRSLAVDEKTAVALALDQALHSSGGSPILSTVATAVIESYGNTAINVINAYRTGGERVIGFVDQRFEAAVNAGGALSTSSR